ncbi:MAG: HAMP domain-containing histidine kinase [Oscillospiraceae bacterium]|jgi:signal transduction histidine kinase|nr:HAMP domain-containing histidine kinase [Oscillospiraceae bacterium]
MLKFSLKRDIRKMNSKLANIISNDTNAQLTTDTFDKDITVLAANVNLMLERNRHDLSEKDRAETTLKRAVTNISHDLRTPLTSALGYLQMLETSELDSETAAQYIEIIRGRLDSLSTLMNNLFEYASVLEGDTEPDLQEINICNVLRDVLSDNYTNLIKNGFEVEADIPETPVICYCDKALLQRIFHNLIKNVCVHGRDYLYIRLENNVVEIANKADGLSELNTDTIFERFYTADASRTSKNTGLGLAIAKELANRIGAKLSAEVRDELLVIIFSVTNAAVGSDGFG